MPDIYSYAEDDMVLDPNLAVHLAHFGINIQQMQKARHALTSHHPSLVTRQSRRWRRWRLS